MEYQIVEKFLMHVEFVMEMDLLVWVVMEVTLSHFPLIYSKLFILNFEPLFNK